jgi:hypothetical protein
MYICIHCQFGMHATSVQACCTHIQLASVPRVAGVQTSGRLAAHSTEVDPSHRLAAQLARDAPRVRGLILRQEESAPKAGGAISAAQLRGSVRHDADPTEETAQHIPAHRRRIGHPPRARVPSAHRRAE